MPLGTAFAVSGVLLFSVVCVFLGVQDAESALGRRRKHFELQWVQPLVQPTLHLLTWLSLLALVDKMLLTLGSMYIWCQGSATVAAPGGGAGLARDYEPKVLVQIPMRNEWACYKRGIAAACRLDWPVEKLVIQIIDDSDDKEIVALSRLEVDKWRALGAPIWHLRRSDPGVGQKAGALDYGLEHPSQEGCEFVAILDADFVPARDFLHKTVAHFGGHPRRGVVQARWAFINQHQNLLTRFQDIDLSFHHRVEQPVQSYFVKFFCFNGTAAVWRIAAVRDAGGWLHRSTTEDLDLSPRAHMSGWEFLYVEVPVPSELPSTYTTLRKQRFRWHAGPARLLTLMWREILESPKLTLMAKVHLVVLFFGMRPCVQFLPNALLFAVVIPAAVLVPADPASFGAPLALLHAIPLLWNCDPGDWPLVVPFPLFENVLGLTKVWAIVSGLLNLKGANEWVVTAKTGVGEDAKTGELDATGEPDAAAEDAYNSDESNEATYSPAPNGQNSRTCQRILGDHLVGQDEQVVSRRFTVSLEQSSQAPVTKHRRGAPSALGSSPLREAASAGTERLSPTGGPGESESSSRKGWRWPGIDPRAERRFSKPLPRVFCIRWRRMRAGFRSFWAKRKVHGPELVVAAWCLGAACAGSVMGGARSVLFLWMQGGAALAVALDLIVW